MKELWYFLEVLEASWAWPCCVLTKVWWWDRQTDRQLEAHKGICFTAGWRASDVVTDISLHRHFPSPGRLWRSHWSSLRLTTYLRRGRCVSVSAIRKYRGHLQLLWHPQGFLHYNIDIAPTTVPLISTSEGNIRDISDFKLSFYCLQVFQGCSPQESHHTHSLLGSQAEENIEWTVWWTVTCFNSPTNTWHKIFILILVSKNATENVECGHVTPPVLPSILKFAHSSSSGEIYQKCTESLSQESNCSMNR